MPTLNPTWLARNPIVRDELQRGELYSIREYQSDQPSSQLLRPLPTPHHRRWKRRR